jgi:hypothetical protein
MAGSKEWIIPSLVYPLNGPTTLPTALEWKSRTIWVGGLIHLESCEEWLSTGYQQSGVLFILTPIYGWLKGMDNP